MKKILGILVSLVVGFTLASTNAVAHEGTLELSGKEVSCRGVSVWNESNYRISGRCQGLVYPYATQYEHYSLWAKLKNGNTIRVDDIDRGYFEGNVTSEFESVSVTAETSSSPRRPSEIVIVSGKVAEFDFGTAKKVEPQATPTPATTSTSSTMTVQNTAAAATSASSVVGKILKSLLVIVGVVILITVVASLIFRRRGSISS